VIQSASLPSSTGVFLGDLIMQVQPQGSRRANQILVASVIVVILVVSTGYLLFASSSNTIGFAQASCCTSPLAKGNLQNKEIPLQPDRTNIAINAALAYYQERYDDSTVTATARDYGCHIEVTIFKEGQPVKTLIYANGEVLNLQ